LQLKFALVNHAGFSTNFQEQKLRHSLTREGKGMNEVDEDEIVLHALIKCLLSITINLISSPSPFHVAVLSNPLYTPHYQTPIAVTFCIHSPDHDNTISIHPYPRVYTLTHDLLVLNPPKNPTNTSSSTRYVDHISQPFNVPSFRKLYAQGLDVFEKGTKTGSALLNRVSTSQCVFVNCLCLCFQLLALGS
jgi:hypothetical protein